MDSKTPPDAQRVFSTSPSEVSVTINITEGDNVTTRTSDGTNASEMENDLGHDRTSKRSYLIGVGFTLAASWAFAFQNYWVKKASGAGFRTFQSLLGRGVIQVLCTGIIDLYDIYASKPITTGESEIISKTKTAEKNLAPQNRKDWIYIILVGILGFTCAYCNFGGTELLPQGMMYFAVLPSFQ